jgi:hypothetical protein
MHAIVRGFAVGVVLLSVGACSDSTSPRSSAPRNLTASAPVFDFAATASSVGVTNMDFVVGSGGGSFTIAGLYTITFPANSVCDPNRSTYGSTEWDKDCTVLDAGQYVKVHATLSLSSGGLAVDFSPALRFSPSTKVIISTDIFAPIIAANPDYFSKNPHTLDALAILYSPALGGPGVKDFSIDHGVMTHVDLKTGRIWRRVKHFSGYSMTTGESCDPSPDNPDCIAIDTDGDNPDGP